MIISGVPLLPHMVGVYKCMVLLEELTDIWFVTDSSIELLYSYDEVSTILHENQSVYSYCDESGFSLC